VITSPQPHSDKTVPERRIPAIRPARQSDVPEIAALVNGLARQGQLLPRSPQSIAATIDAWIVATTGEQLLGCVSLLRYTSGLVEVRSLAVRESAQGRGIGSRLMHAAIAAAVDRDIPVLFALTRAVPFFEKFGFQTTEKAFFPEKVWHDCSVCPLIDNCDETAMVLRLDR
jgi:amino-acid N-acetyltransferase